MDYWTRLTFTFNVHWNVFLGKYMSYEQIVTSLFFFLLWEQQVLNNHLFYTWQCVYANPNLQTYPTSVLPLVSMCLFPMSVEPEYFLNRISTSLFFLAPLFLLPSLTSRDPYTHKFLRFREFLQCELDSFLALTSAPRTALYHLPFLVQVSRFLFRSSLSFSQS